MRLQKQNRLVKRICSTLLAVLLLISGSETTFLSLASANSGDIANGTMKNATWTISENGTLTVVCVGATTVFESEADQPWASYRSNILSAQVLSNSEAASFTDMSYWFKDCTNLTTIGQIPSTVQKFSYTFENCRSLKNVCELPKGATVLSGAFKNCTNLESISFIPYENLRYASYMFQGCANLKHANLVIGTKLQNLNYAFSGCVNLRGNIILNRCIESTDPYSVNCTNIFNGCANMEGSYIHFFRTNINWPYDKTLATSDNGILSDTNVSYYRGKIDISTYDYSGNTSWLIYSTTDNQTNSVKNILFIDGYGDMTGSSKFFKGSLKASELSQVRIGNGITNITSSAFKGCTSLSLALLPSSIVSIEASAFKNCSSLSSISLPEGLKTIGKNAFSYSGLTSITIPEKIESIESGAFENCTSMESAFINGKIVSDSMFNGCIVLSSVNLGNSIESIGNNAFSKTMLSEIILPDSLKTIGDEAFAELYITELTIPNSVQSIGAGAFRGLPIMTVKLPDGIAHIANDTFSDCTELLEINIPPSVTTIGEASFKNCINLTSLNLGNLISYVGKDCFYGCSQDFVIICSKGSYIQKYAEENAIRCHYLDKLMASYDDETIIEGSVVDLSKIHLYWVYSDDGYNSVEGDEFSTLGYLPENEISFDLSDIGVTYNDILPDTQNDIQITYNGFSTILHIQGVKKKIISFRAEFIGEGITEGCSIPKNKVRVTADYDNGETDVIINDWDYLKEYVILPNFDNEITIQYTGEDADIYEDLSEITAVFYVPGIEKKAVSMRAVYDGEAVEHGVLNPENINVYICYNNTSVDEWFKVYPDLYEIGDYTLEKGVTSVNVYYIGDDIKTELSTKMDVTVIPIQVKFEKVKSKMIVGETQNIELKANDKSALDSFYVTWRSTNLNVATVEDGMVTAVGNGTSTISAKVSGVVIKFKVTVKTPSAAVVLDRTSITLMKGKTSTLIAAMYPKTSTDTLKWKSSNTAVATVTSKGKVKGISSGKAVITVTTSNGHRAKCTVHVKEEPSMISLNRSHVYLQKGKKLTLRYTIPSGTKTTVRWYTSDKRVATVTSKGVVTGKRAGICKITIKTKNGKKATCKITVKK